ncbi:MAG: arylsulfatase A, partial [Pirellulaceae bacterium]
MMHFATKKNPFTTGNTVPRFTYLVLAIHLALGLVTESRAAESETAENPPNLVFIFVDDQGYYDLGCFGASEVKTPRIDAMASEGTRFTDYYAAAPICSPSRA